MLQRLFQGLLLGWVLCAGSAMAGDVNELRKLLGYGGFIHNLKNYVLRNDDTHRESAQVQLSSALKLVDRVLIAHPGHEHASTLRVTLQRYQNQLDTAQTLIESGADPTTVDRMIVTNDNPALAAIERWEALEQQSIQRAEHSSQLMHFGAVLLALVAATMCWRNIRLARRARDMDSHFTRLQDHERQVGRLLNSLSTVRDTAGIAIFEYIANDQTISKGSSLASLFEGDAPPTTLDAAMGLFPAEFREPLARNLRQSVSLDSHREFDLANHDLRLRVTLEPILSSGRVLCMVQRQLAVPRDSLEEQRKTLSELADTRADRIRKLRSGLKKAQIDLVNLQKAAHKDPLTNTFNRLGFGERLRSEVQRARRKDQTLGILMVDIDHFKEVNDTFGHAIGDNALQLLANTLEGLVRSQGGDIVGRLGGDEFIVVLADATASHAERTLKMARAMLNEEPIPECPDINVRVQISGGSVTLNPATDEPGEVIKLADAALYRQKEVRHLNSNGHTIK
ncbi:diguanylate cyclase [Litorivicinus lipolyticus]|uniref:GGDEF domain-containing protein n=1 Tax=Litorivicinus lipolyticus TaxID=418701 RepID=UPI003B5B71F3